LNIVGILFIFNWEDVKLFFLKNYFVQFVLTVYNFVLSPLFGLILWQFCTVPSLWLKCSIFIDVLCDGVMRIAFASDCFKFDFRKFSISSFYWDLSTVCFYSVTGWIILVSIRTLNTSRLNWMSMYVSIISLITFSW